LVMAPYAPWSSDRSPRTPLRRRRFGAHLGRGGPQVDAAL